MKDEHSLAEKLYTARYVEEFVRDAL